MYDYKKYINSSIVSGPLNYTKITREAPQPPAAPDINNEIRLLKAMIQKQNSKIGELTELLNQALTHIGKHEESHISNVYNVTLQADASQTVGPAGPQEIDMEELAEKIRRIIS
ncbi:MAG: hypothetical protein QW728_07735, partial [Thermoplasmata archaeon]